MSKKILVIDDEPAIVKVVKSRLEANKYQVISASDGEEGLTKIVSEKPDLVILDLMMPKMDGYNMLINIKEMSETIGIQDVPVIVLTARGEQKIKDMVEHEKIADYMVKPFKGEELVAKVKKILGE